ncbi:hypothetical protein [Pseudomonas brassicacearum]|uniref:hypothetical protein n=1 Tax=Pseudomonas brassicacearum TaxID=930166 RepID=UPI00160C8FF5|nr:hypothetical protein [Pseudomonas brassicacearum]
MPEEQKVQCTRCRNKHLHTDRTSVPNTTISGMRDLVCPRCNCRSYYSLDADGKRSA